MVQLIISWTNNLGQIIVLWNLNKNIYVIPNEGCRVKNQERSPVIIIGRHTNPLHIDKKSWGWYDTLKKL